MNIDEFIEARLEETRAGFRDLTVEQAERMNKTLEVIEVVLEMHKGWPILIEGPMKFDPPKFSDPQDYTNHLQMSVTREFEFVIQEEFIKRFGTLPPTTAMVRQIATIWSDHPDFDSAWTMDEGEWRKMFPRR